MRPLKTMILVLALAAPAVAGCGKKDEDNSTKDTPATAGQVAPASETPATGQPPGADDKSAAKPDIAVDAELMQAIDAVVANCQIDTKSARIECANKEDAALSDLFGYQAPKKTAFTTIATMAVALADDDENKRTVAANILGNKHQSGWGDEAKPGSVSKQVAETLLAAVPKLGQYQGRRAITAVAYAAGLAGETDKLIEVLDASTDAYLKNSGYKASMFYGRMTVFPKIQELAKSDDPATKLAAVSAAANFYKYTDEEKATLCPWAVEQLPADGDEVKESPIFEQAGYVLQRCGGEWIDKLLDFGEQQLADKNRFDRMYYFVYRNLCFSMMGEKSAADETQCERNYKFLEKAANNNKLSARERAFALDAIPYQRRDKKSLQLMKKYKKSKVPEIKKTAEDAIKMLESYVKKK
jgi:hypothetical protein